MSVPCGVNAAMYIGPICDDCVEHMTGYLLTTEDAIRITKEVRDFEASLLSPPRQAYSFAERHAS